MWKGRKEIMNKINTYFKKVILIGSFPLILRIVYDVFLGKQIKCIDYFSEIYFLTLFICAYNYITFSVKDYLLNKFSETSFLISIMSTIMSTSIYLFSFSEQTNLIVKNVALNILFVLALINVIITLFFTKIFPENDDEHYSENRYEKYSENRYERYLLERIDEKLNSIKTPKSEKSEEESKEIINPEELMNGSDILAEMLKNHIEIKEYFRISKNQSKFSFYFSIVSSVVGIIVVIMAASGMVVFKNLGISIIAAVSGAITEIISGIVLWIHNKSALQLNYYYDSLHENEKFLSAVNIADKLSEEKKEDMYIEIIRKQIDIPAKDKEHKASDTDKKQDLGLISKGCPSSWICLLDTLIKRQNGLLLTFLFPFKCS